MYGDRDIFIFFSVNTAAASNHAAAGRSNVCCTVCYFTFGHRKRRSVAAYIHTAAVAVNRFIILDGPAGHCNCAAAYIQSAAVLCVVAAYYSPAFKHKRAAVKLNAAAGSYKGIGVAGFVQLVVFNLSRAFYGTGRLIAEPYSSSARLFRGSSLYRIGAYFTAVKLELYANVFY